MEPKGSPVNEDEERGMLGRLACEGPLPLHEEIRKGEMDPESLPPIGQEAVMLLGSIWEKPLMALNHRHCGKCGEESGGENIG